MSTAIAIEEARDRLDQLAERAKSENQEFLLTKNGRTIARIVPEIEWPPSGDPVLSAEETRLFKVINKTLTLVEWKLYKELRSKHEAETISESERRMLVGIYDKLERFHGDRLHAIHDLATLKVVPFRSLLNKLGVRIRRPG